MFDHQYSPTKDSLTVFASPLRLWEDRLFASFHWWPQQVGQHRVRGRSKAEQETVNLRCLTCEYITVARHHNGPRVQTLREPERTLGRNPGWRDGVVEIGVRDDPTTLGGLS